MSTLSDSAATGDRTAQVLAPQNILEICSRSLGDGGNLNNSWEAVALLGHACMVAVDFRLIGLDEEQRIETEATSQALPREWNANSTYSFKYAHQQSSMQYLLKISRLGGNAVIFALALGDDKTTSFDLPVKDYISESALPLTLSTDRPDALSHVFISPSRLNDFIGLFKLNVIQKLAPGLQKEGYEDTRQQRAPRPAEERQQQPERQPIRDPLRDDRFPEPARPYPFDDPLAAPPRRPVPPGDFPPPGFEDEYEINRPPRGYHPGGGIGGIRRPDIGERDLYPPGLGPHDPLRPHFGPSGGGGGMHPTFDDPMFGGNRGEGEGEGYNPQIPPGARYDPVGPGQGPSLGRGRGFNFPGGPRGGRGGGFGGGFGGFGGDII
ncbi:hypothetical protein AJ80_04935 [Polytolypa hystricis UAMH7299]|uniref:Uncharacterized protein n=1 Tax=Polytolypa hystricis (strain UAMH7299) TaxID=1447883 RepID=A0A2B7Y857_POLH7|nr:hypothetical protein AJ80_04935 [Polytolypa hystricis UAMH7299]